MKQLSIILVLSIFASTITFTSCKKEDSSTPSNSVNTNDSETTDGFEGTYTMNVNNDTYTHLQNAITLMNESLQIPGKDNSDNGFVFQSNNSVGAVGETRNICLEGCTPTISTSLMIDNNIPGFNATSGTIKRVSEYVVEFNLTQDYGDGNPKTLTATVHIGKIVNTNF